MQTELELDETSKHRSLTHVSSDFLSPEDIFSEYTAISKRLTESSEEEQTKTYLLSLLKQLSEFELGRFLIKNKGALSG